MLHDLVSKARQLLGDLHRRLLYPPSSPQPARPSSAPREAQPLAPLQRVTLTDQVGRTLFEEYAQHRSAARGEDETGWVLMGLREAREAIILATLPAGAEAEASASHVRFNSEAQAVASRIVRQKDRRLTILGVAHTHPGRLRHPSDGDYRGDRQWVEHLRGKEGVFAIGTADAPAARGAPVAYQPRPHVQCWGELRFSWYALGQRDSSYRPLPVELTHGPDLARELHLVWEVLETHARRIDRLFCQQVGLRFEVAEDEWGPALVLTLPLARSGDLLRVVVRPKQVRYYVLLDGQLLEVEQGEDRIDRGIYLLLAELAARLE